MIRLKEYLKHMQITKFLKTCIGVSIVALSLGFLFQSVKRVTVSAATTRSSDPAVTPTPTATAEKNIRLGAFSMSLDVKDLAVSKAFYENLGFKMFGGDMKKNYVIMKNGNTLIGLFHGMFKNNILTFNPGWDENAKNTAVFDDVREIQRELQGKGIKLDTEVVPKTTGPGFLEFKDPDGNAILIDQHR